MAITINDIREKEFTKQVRGYSIDEVDDFLDELTAQMEAMIKENRELAAEVESLRSGAVAVATTTVVEPVPAAPAAAAAPLIDEPQYFKNLETTVRETLLNAQRLADETVSEARKKANGILSNAEEQAANITSSAKAEAEAARAEAEDLKANAKSYRSRFTHMLQEQVNALNLDESLFE